jgi:hypothetical protein
VKAIRVLAVSSFLPFPEDRGDPIRVAMFLRCLSESSKLTVYAVRRPSTTEHDVDALCAQLGSAAVETFAARPVGSSRVAAARRWLRAMATRTPPWIANRFSSELAARMVETRSDFDLVVILGDAAGAYVDTTSLARVHLDKVNVLSRSTAADAAEASRWQSKLRLAMVARISRSYERRLLNRVDSVSVTSSDEAVRLLQDYGRTPDLVLPSAIAVSSFRPPYEGGGNHVVWLGSLEYRSNIMGLDRFLAEGMDQLRRAGLTLVVAGSGGSRSIEDRLRQTVGVEYRGYVEDLWTLVPGSRAAVVPLWSGAGVKLKTLTLMNLGLPVVATTTAMEGIATEGALAVADDPRSIVAALVRATDRELEAARIRAFAILERDFSPAAFARRLATSLHALGGT